MPQRPVCRAVEVPKIRRCGVPDAGSSEIRNSRTVEVTDHRSADLWQSGSARVSKYQASEVCKFRRY